MIAQINPKALGKKLPKLVIHLAEALIIEKQGSGNKKSRVNNCPLNNSLPKSKY
jgi:hypothetical protein